MGTKAGVRATAFSALTAAVTVIPALTATPAMAAPTPVPTQAPAAARTVPVVDLGGLPGIAHNGASAINNHGDIVGSGYNGSYGSQGFRWSWGVLTALPATARAPFLINDAGQIAGSNPQRFSSTGFVIRAGGAVVDPGFVPADQNQHGLVVGTGPVTGGGTHAMTWQDGHTTDLGAPAGYSSQAIAVSGSGQILGELDRLDHQGVTFARWTNGHWAPLPNSGGRAVDINDRGDVVGWSTTPAGITHAVLWQGSHLVDLDPQGSVNSQAVDIDDAGQIVGVTFAPASDEGHILIWNGPHRTDLGTFGGSFTRPVAVNDQGDLVVATSTAAFRWYHGQTVRLGGTASPAAINNRGQVVGSVLLPDGTSHAALWN